MNERIKQLAEQAADEIADLFSPGFFDDKMVNDVAEINQKFAELIVQDSIKQILEWKNEPFPFDEHTAVWILKKHFGVED
jgi:hypothetical protein